MPLKHLRERPSGFLINELLSYGSVGKMETTTIITSPTFLGLRITSLLRVHLAIGCGRFRREWSVAT